MYDKRIKQIEEQILKIKQELTNIGEMRPGSLTRQYREPKEKIGPYYQISYTHKMKSHTEYVRPMFIKDVKSQIASYKHFKKLMEKWVQLAIKHSQLKMKLAKKELDR